MPLRVLIVEDERFVARPIELWLRSRGERPRWCADLAAAAEALADGPFELVLCDVEVGDGDGIRFVPRVRAAWPAARVVVMSGRQDDWAERALRAGADATLAKPFDVRHALGAELERCRTRSVPVSGRAPQRREA